MGAIISIFQWIWKLLDTALKWASELPGKLILFVTTFVTTLVSIFAFFTSHVSDVVTIIDNGSSSVSEVSSMIGNTTYGGLLVHVMSLDVAAQYIVSVGGVFLGAISMVVLALFGYAMTCWVIPMALMVVQKMISVVSAGFIKT